MKDAKNQEFEIGDYVLYRENFVDSEFDSLGVIEALDDDIIDIKIFGNMIIHKFPRNVQKITRDEAMLWKLENS